MALKIKVKVGNISNLSDARYCAGMGTDMLGFTVARAAEGFIDPKTYQDIRGWVSGPAIVAEACGVEADEASWIVENYLPDYLAIDSAQANHFAAETSLPLIINLRAPYVEAARALDEIKEKVAYVVIDHDALRAGALQLLAARYNILLAVDNVALLADIDTLKVAGIAINGSKEIRPGLKDYDFLEAIFEQLSVAD